MDVSFVMLQHNSQIKKEEDDDNNNMLKHVIYVFYFAPVQLHKEDNNTNIFF